jgi:hypothetical protein
MVPVTSGLRWAIGLWSALAIAMVAWSIVAGVRPVSTAVLFVICAAPLGVVATLVGFRAEPRTAAQVLHTDDRQPGPR